MKVYSSRANQPFKIYRSQLHIKNKNCLYKIEIRPQFFMQLLVSYLKKVADYLLFIKNNRKLLQKWWCYGRTGTLVTWGGGGWHLWHHHVDYMLMSCKNGKLKRLKFAGKKRKTVLEPHSKENSKHIFPKSQKRDLASKYQIHIPKTNFYNSMWSIFTNEAKG